jgi:cyclic nucleotide gated channel alpha 3
LYNFWFIIYRHSFNEIVSENKLYWFTCDYFADFLYVCDILFNFRTGFLEEGVLQTDPIRLRHHYMNTTRFYIDCLCLMPLDILYLSLGYKSVFRFFRLVKIYKFFEFIDRTERHINFPNVFRTIVLLHNLFAIFHWNACFSNLLSTYLSNDFALINNNSKMIFDQNNKTIENNELKKYLKAFYVSTKIMTLVGGFPNPQTNIDYLFAIFQLIISLLLFAMVMGHVGYIVSNLGNARKDFQCKLFSEFPICFTHLKFFKIIIITKINNLI